MAFDKTEQEIIKRGLELGKTQEEVKAAISNYRKGVVPNPTAQTPKMSAFGEFKQDMQQTFQGMTESVTRGMETAEEAKQQVYSLERSPLQGTARTIGGGLRAGAEVVGNAVLGLGKALLPQKAEDAIAEKVGGAVESVANTKAVQELMAQYQSLDEQTKENVQSAIGVAEGVTTMFGVGPVVQKVRKTFGDGVVKMLKESDDVLTAKRISTPRPTGVTTGTLGGIVKDFRLQISDIDPQLETVLKRSNIDDVRAHFNQASLAKADDLVPTPFEIVARKGSEGLDVVTKSKIAAINAKKAILDQAGGQRLTGDTLNTVYRNGVQSFGERFGVKIDSKGNVSTLAGRVSKLDASDQKLIEEYFQKLTKLGIAPSLREVDDFIDWGQSQLYKQGQSLTKTDVAGEPVIAALRKVNGDLNNVLKQQVDNGYADINQRIRDLMLIEDELNRGLGVATLPDGTVINTRGAGFVKRLFSPTGENTRRAFEQLRQETGIDLAKEARLAKFAMESVGDTRQASLLKQLDIALQEAAELDLTKPMSIIKWLRERADLDGEDLAEQMLKKLNEQKIDLSTSNPKSSGLPNKQGGMLNLSKMFDDLAAAFGSPVTKAQNKYNQTQEILRQVKNMAKEGNATKVDIANATKMNDLARKELLAVKRSQKGGYINPKEIADGLKGSGAKTPKNLIEEAKKYKSAEEFVGAQETVYHGSSVSFGKFDANKQKNGWLGKAFYFTPNKSYAKTAGKNVKEVVLDYKNPFIVKGNSPNDVISELRNKFPSENIDEFNIAEVLTKNGYDAIEYTHWDNEVGKMIAVFNDNTIKTRSQLEDIWKQANNK